MKLETNNEALKTELNESIAKLEEENETLGESVSNLHEENKALRSDLSIQHKNYGVFRFFAKLPPKIRL
jgi:cell division protein FtsB